MSLGSPVQDRPMDTMRGSTLERKNCIRHDKTQSGQVRGSIVCTYFSKTPAHRVEDVRASCCREKIFRFVLPSATLASTALRVSVGTSSTIDTNSFRTSIQ